ncbi:MAG: cobalamin-dependent protein [Chloroflexales bacterium]
MPVFHHQPDTIAASYLAALMAGDRGSALHVVQAALAEEMPLTDLYQEVLQLTLYEIGHMWECGQLAVANEHVATAITHSVMEYCARIIPPIPEGPVTIIATSVGHELHDIGLRMVTDCLELDGWNTLYLGSNTPLNDVVALAVQHRVAVVAVSITMSSYARDVRDLITALRQSALGAGVQILAGGQPFNRIPNLWRQIEADGTAADLTGATAWVRAHVPR